MYSKCFFICGKCHWLIVCQSAGMRRPSLPPLHSRIPDPLDADDVDTDAEEEVEDSVLLRLSLLLALAAF